MERSSTLSSGRRQVWLFVVVALFRARVVPAKKDGSRRAAGSSPISAELVGLRLEELEQCRTVAETPHEQWCYPIDASHVVRSFVTWFIIGFGRFKSS